MTIQMDQLVDTFKGLEPAEQKEALKKTISAAEDEVTKDALSSPEIQDKVVAAIPPPSAQVSNFLWIVIFGILGVVIIGGGIVGVIADGSDETAVYGFVGIALGAVVGLVAPGPKMMTK
ncbi:hypothetical protein OHA21_17290 [Actinoplanes sp. NBC_00393]|uniref:hypothetical protein n=1 Tax=Actinoplanes sp. NBC_00393 TaxID=2975953 RepID=UPI002E1B9A97